MTDVGFFKSKTALLKSVNAKMLDEIGAKNGSVFFKTVFPDWRENATFPLKDFKNGKWHYKDGYFPAPVSSQEALNVIVDCMESDTWMKGVSVSYYFPEGLKGCKTTIHARKDAISQLENSVRKMF